MKQVKIEAPTLEEAYNKASEEFNRSVTELDIKVLQPPSKGILGIGKKNAIILVTCHTEEDETKPAPKLEKSREQNEIFDNFYKEKSNLEDIAADVEFELKRLFSQLCYELDKIEVKPYNENTLLIEFDGKDAALLIGKEGYRYKALSYMLFNWLNSKYGVQIRLEIAQFLKTQEESVKNYLKPFIEKVKKEGRGQTKPLDGVLIQIALKELREVFPNKYVAIKENRYGEKYILINDFRNK